jgi:hypothetical protein
MKVKLTNHLIVIGSLVFLLFGCKFGQLENEITDNENIEITDSQINNDKH